LLIDCNENESCRVTRDIIETVEWECKVHKNLSNVDLCLRKYSNLKEKEK